jgi:Ceramidase
MQVCPWSEFAPPVISFCEHRRCGWIAEPANAFSNIAYVIVGLWVLGRTQIPLAFRRLAAFVAIVLGMMSFAFHASATRMGEVLDVSSMYLLPALSFAVSFAILNQRGMSVRFALLPVAIWLAATITMLVFHNDGTNLFTGLSLLAVGADAYLLLRAKGEHRFRYLGLSIAAVLTGYGIWWLDKLGIWCNPHNHIVNGHAVWHCMTALSIAFHYLHIEAKFKRAQTMR